MNFDYGSRFLWRIGSWDWMYFFFSLSFFSFENSCVGTKKEELFLWTFFVEKSVVSCFFLQKNKPKIKKKFYYFYFQGFFVITEMKEMENEKWRKKTFLFEKKRERKKLIRLRMDFGFWKRE